MATDRASLSKVVSDQIRGQILAGTLRPGERLVEDKLSAELGVSRVPVREALLGLSVEGLVNLEPRRGASVVEISPETVQELVEVRALLEGLNARLAARRHDPAIVAELSDALRRGNAAAGSGSAEELAQLNAEFHDLLAVASRNTVLSGIMRSLRERTSLAFVLNGQAGRGRTGRNMPACSPPSSTATRNWPSCWPLVTSRTPRLLSQRPPRRRIQPPSDPSSAGRRGGCRRRRLKIRR